MALVEVGGEIEDGGALDWRRDVVRQLAFRSLNFDHVRAQLPQELGGPGSDRGDTQIKDANAVENTGHRASLLEIRVGCNQRREPQAEGNSRNQKNRRQWRAPTKAHR